MNWRPHARYLRYVLLHKFYVFRAGHVIRQTLGVPESALRWYWRLLVHDLSKFGRAEWEPYVAMFYGDAPDIVAANEIASGTATIPPVVLTPTSDAVMFKRLTERAAEIKKLRQARFNAAWLHHIHVNAHHWQHHILHEDSGKTLILVPHAALAYEMVADWLAAGPKALRAHTMGEATAETIVWYAHTHKAQQMREIVRNTAENILHALAIRYGIDTAAQQINSAKATRASITIPGR
jgi:hypothetical protein